MSSGALQPDRAAISCWDALNSETELVFGADEGLCTGTNAERRKKREGLRRVLKVSSWSAYLHDTKQALPQQHRALVIVKDLGW